MYGSPYGFGYGYPGAGFGHGAMGYGYGYPGLGYGMGYGYGVPAFGYAYANPLFGVGLTTLAVQSFNIEANVLGRRPARPIPGAEAPIFRQVR